MDLDELRSRFPADDFFTIDEGEGRLARVRLRAAGFECETYLQGATVTHFGKGGEPPLFFISPKSSWTVGKAIRGGIPVIFPWFGDHPGDAALPAHGFVRTAPWTLEEVRRDGEASVAVLSVESSERTRRQWPHDFRLSLTVRCSDTFSISMKVENRSSEPFRFEEALHTYFLVDDVERVTVDGLQGTTFIDKNDALRRKETGDMPVRLSRATDNVYLSVGPSLSLRDELMPRTISITTRGARTAIVWNPWGDKAASMADLGPDVWRRFLCVESANAADDAIELPSGQTHEMQVEYAIGS